MDLFPRARRVLLTAYADTDAAIDAINVVDLDHYLLKPWNPPEEKLYPVRRLAARRLAGDARGGHDARYASSATAGRRRRSRCATSSPATSCRTAGCLADEPEGAAPAHRGRAHRGRRAAGRHHRGQDAGAAERGRAGRQRRADHRPRPRTSTTSSWSAPARPGSARPSTAPPRGCAPCWSSAAPPAARPGRAAGSRTTSASPTACPASQLTDRARRQALQVRRRAADHPRGGRRWRPPARPGWCASATAAAIAAHSVVLATGVSYRMLDAPGLDDLTGRGVFYGSAATEAPSCADEDVYIVGGANSAGQAAVYFARYARRVHMLIRGADLTRSMSQLPHRPDRRRSTTSRCTRTPRCARGDGRRPPGAARRCATSRTGETRTVDTLVAVHLHRRASRAPTGSTAWSPATRDGFVRHRARPARRRQAAGRLDPAARPVPPGVQRARRLRRRRRAGRLGQAGRLGGRRGRDGGLAGAPVPGGAVTTERTRAALAGRAADAVPVRDARRRAARAGCAEHGRVETHRRPAPRSTPRATRRPASTCCSSGDGRAEPAGARRRRRGHPHRASAASTRGATQAYLGDQVAAALPATRMRAITDVELFVLPADDVRRPRCATGSRWRCTCSRGCSSACATSRP